MLINHSFHIPQLNRSRTIRIYLPPSYESGKRYYSVLYMQDGQNLFRAEDAFARPWYVGKMIDKMPIKRQAIVVGIDNGGVDRLQEYAPYKRGTHGGQGQDYLRFLVETLKPFIDRSYRTLTTPDHTWLVGSSMGGLISFQGGWHYPSVFGKVGVLSPAFWFNPMVLKQNIVADLSQTQFYLVGSRTESRGMAPALEQAYWKLKDSGVANQNLTVIIRDKGGHNEAFWGRELRKMYQAFMSDKSSG